MNLLFFGSTFALIKIRINCSQSFLVLNQVIIKREVENGCIRDFTFSGCLACAPDLCFSKTRDSIMSVKRLSVRRAD